MFLLLDLFAVLVGTLLPILTLRLALVLLALVIAHASTLSDTNTLLAIMSALAIACMPQPHLRFLGLAALVALMALNDLHSQNPQVFAVSGGHAKRPFMVNL